MRNFYIRLNIAPTASEQEIKAAIAKSSNSTLKADASEILLNPSRRRHYDQAHQTLSDIGILRAHLGLNHGSNWASPESSDFNTNPIHGLSLHDELVEKIKSLNKKSKVNGFISLAGEYISGIIWVAAICGLIAIFFEINSHTSKAPSTHSVSSQAAVSKSTPHQPIQSAASSIVPTFNEPALQLPTSGKLRKFTSNKALAPLEIRTDSGSNYLIKLEDTSTGKNVIDVFIRGGSTIKIKVPLGTYRLKYATGQTWYGYEHYFGPSTGYNKADSNFRFYNDGNRVSGYTVTLYQVSDGNLQTSHLSPSQF